jgi:uncharacterized protein (TIGR00290 family)
VNRAVLFWSGGKDSAWALRVCDAEVVALVTTFDAATNKVPVHDVPLEWIQQQADLLKLPLWAIPLRGPSTNLEYCNSLNPVYQKARNAGATSVVFGDLFLEDIRQFREAALADSGLVPLFPLWGRITAELATEMIDGGIDATITGIDRNRLDASFLGRPFDRDLLNALPAGVDPCGENGEFHTYVHEPHRLLNLQRH